MYVVKDKFNLISTIDNIENLNKSQIDRMALENGVKKMYNSIRTTVVKSGDQFYARVISNISMQKKYGLTFYDFIPILYDNYKMAVVYNKPTKDILINISYYNVDDIYGNKPDPRTLISCIIYGFVLERIIEKKVNIHESFAGPIITFLNTAVLSIFGKNYGLIGAYSNRIPILKYLTACYVLCSFFGISGNNLFEKAKQYANVDFRDDTSELSKYDFSNILHYIKVISDAHIMPGFNVHEFTNKIYRFLGIHFLAAFEDFSRFMALMTISSIAGNTFVPFSLKKYNQKEYNKIILTCKKLFT